MRILIDECLNWRLARALPGHYCASVSKMGWSGIQNGELMTLAQENGFDVFITGDRNLSYQQNTSRYGLAIVVLAAGSTDLNHTLPLMPKVLSLFASLRPGQVVCVR